MSPDENTDWEATTQPLAEPRPSAVAAGDYAAPPEPSRDYALAAEPPRPAESAWSRFVELVRLEQTVFALPFAYIGMFLAANGWPGFKTFAWVSLAMVGARTAGMTANRIIDMEIDGANPRTSDRALPAGRMAPRTAGVLMVASFCLLGLSAQQLNPLCLKLAPLAVVLLLGYSYLKRLTWACHLGLGLVQACAPLGGWLAVSGRFEAAPVFLAVAIFLWVGGFDILYACQDIDHDRAHGLHSIPARLGIRKAFQVSRMFHFTAVAALAMAGWVLGLSGIYYTGVGLVGAILVWEQNILTPEDLSRMQQAFFVANAAVSLTLLVAVLLEVLW